MRFEFYVLNYDFNGKEVKMYNIFNNCKVQECVEKEVKRYLRSPIKYKNKTLLKETQQYGFEALESEVDWIIKWQEWGRHEYEISAGEPFEDDCSKLKRWDCYQQAHANIKMITYEVIRQYKEQIKKEKNKNAST